MSEALRLRHEHATACQCLRRQCLIFEGGRHCVVRMLLLRCHRRRGRLRWLRCLLLLLLCLLLPPLCLLLPPLCLLPLMCLLLLALEWTP
jgi:hypothetical protein